MITVKLLKKHNVKYIIPLIISEPRLINSVKGEVGIELHFNFPMKHVKKLTIIGLNDGVVCTTEYISERFIHNNIKVKYGCLKIISFGMDENLNRYLLEELL